MQPLPGCKGHQVNQASAAMKKSILLLGLALFTILSGCEKNDARPVEEVLAGLEGKCLQGKVVKGMRCTSAVYVQLLNASTGTTSTFEGKKYKNMVLLGNFPKNSGLGVGDSFYFTINTSSEFDHCTEFYACTTEDMTVFDEPHPVTIKACLKTFSASGCSSK